VVALGIDAGASSTRWLLLEAETELARGTLEPITGHIFRPEDRVLNLGRLESLLTDVLKVAKPGAVAVGMTGFHKATQAEEVFRQFIADTLGLENARIDLDNDMHIAYASAFKPGEGIIIYAGTGSVGYHETRSGERLRSGGYGYLVDDAGAGFWIGHEGIKQVMRWVDESGKPSHRPLAKAIYGVLGSTDWSKLVEVIYGDGRAKIASLSRAVVHAAQQGDEAASKILEAAGRELARLANAIMQRLGMPMPVAFLGGISRASPILNKALEEALPFGVDLKLVQTEPVLAAARLALELSQAS
jgi:N-acetylglucosamine kinase-like BadF-type ATPase